MEPFSDYKSYRMKDKRSLFHPNQELQEKQSIGKYGMGYEGVTELYSEVERRSSDLQAKRHPRRNSNISVACVLHSNMRCNTIVKAKPHTHRISHKLKPGHSVSL